MDYLLNVEDDHSDPMELIHKMKTVIVSLESLPDFRRMLNKTRDYRATLMEKNEVEFKEYFPYFFTHPETMVTFQRI